MLVNERMLESYVAARKWLKPGGVMLPTTSTLFACPFSDAQLFLEVASKAGFFHLDEFHGIDLTSLCEDAALEYFRQPCVEQINPACLVGEPVSKLFDYSTMAESDLYEFEMPFSMTLPTTQELHGIATWFDNAFLGSDMPVHLSTSPYSPLTHWYQVRCLFRRPILVRANETVSGKLHMRINRVQSYDVHITATGSKSGITVEGHLFLKEPNFRFASFPTAPQMQNAPEANE